MSATFAISLALAVLFVFPCVARVPEDALPPNTPLTRRNYMKSILFRESTPERQAELRRLENELNGLLRQIRRQIRERNILRAVRNDKQKDVMRARRELRSVGACQNGKSQLNVDCRRRSFFLQFLQACRALRRERDARRACRLLDQRRRERRVEAAKCNRLSSSKFLRCFRDNVRPVIILIRESQAACQVRDESAARVDRICREGDRFAEAQEALRLANEALDDAKAVVQGLFADRSELQQRIQELIDLINAPPSNIPTPP